MQKGPATDGRSSNAQRPAPGAVVWQLLAILAALPVAGLSADDHWRLAPLLVIGAFTVLSGLTYVHSGASRISISGSFLGVMLAAMLLGGGPGALIGALTTATAWLRRREAGHYFRINLINGIWAPLVAGRFFVLATTALDTGSHALGYYLLVFVTFVVGLGINFLIAVGYQCSLDGASLVHKVRDVLVPVLPAELFSALLTMGAVYLGVTLGTTGLALVGLVLVIFQYLVGELLKSQRRGRELHRLATIDTLTGLVNRDRFHAEVDKRIAGVEETPATFAVMLIDLDRFKEINDTLGHHYGDELLRKIGPRLGASAGPGGVVARLGGDEFALLTPSLEGDGTEVEEVANQLLTCIQRPLYVDELALEVTASIGIARFPADGRDVNTLMRCADVAMYSAKEAHTGWKFYAAQHDRNSMRKLSVLSDFRRALEGEEIVVYYQPIVDVAGVQARGAEALVRWEHPQLGLLAPGAFVAAIEQTGLIAPMTSLVLERSIEQCARWRTEGWQLSVAVNLSMRNLLDRNLPGEVDRMLSAHGLPPEALQLEITESMLMSDPERVLATVSRLNGLGVRLSVDDFGTGYSSLANLRQLPIDELKIDRSFVSPMLRDASDLIIVRSTINLGHDLGLRVIAEGVEDSETLRRLARLGCDMAQGYHLSRPMPATQFGRWLAHNGRSRMAVAV